MRHRLAASSLFPLRYDPAVLVPAGALTAGFLGLEAFLHERHGLLAMPLPLPALLQGLKEVGGLPIWEAVYKGGYALYIAPLFLPAVRVRPGAVRRILAGFAALLALGMSLALLPNRWFPFDLASCLLVANSVFVLACLARQRLVVPALASFGAAGLIALATLFTQRHDVLDVVLGTAAGGGAYGLAYWKELRFLEDVRPWETIDHELRNLWNLLVRNNRWNWEATYAAGLWDFLESASQRPRHYVIAGAVVDRFPKGGACVLDVGCGYGTLYPLLRGRIAEYTGLDLSEQVIRRCRQNFADESRCRFVQAAFETFATKDRYDVVVLNEVLYYFPRRQAAMILRKAASMAGEGGIVVVSMNRNWKASLIWKALSRIARPAQSLKATNVETGSYWTINVYPAAEVSS